MMLKIWIGIVAVLILVGSGKLYVKDSATVEQAIVVEAYFSGLLPPAQPLPQV